LEKFLEPPQYSYPQYPLENYQGISPIKALIISHNHINLLSTKFSVNIIYRVLVIALKIFQN